MSRSSSSTPSRRTPTARNVVTPWLATGSTWNTDFTTLTFTIRSGVKWSDGQPFSANDVVYTFNALKADAALDLNALWEAERRSAHEASTLQGTDQVVFTFSGPAQTYFYYVADQTPIVPQHIWSSEDQTKLDAFADTTPVGTGPYLMSTCSQNNIKYLRNPNYWQSTPGHPVPQIAEVDYPAFLSNDPANLQLAQGQAQWGAQYIPNIQSFYVAKDPANRHYWFPPVVNVAVFPNLTNPLLGQLAVRQAIALAIDRAEVSQRGESGYEPPANQTGIVLPTYQAWYDKTLDTTAYDVAKATQTLEAAGFTKGSDGIYKDAKGNRLSFTIKTISGYTDWDSSVQVIQQELKAAGHRGLEDPRRGQRDLHDRPPGRQLPARLRRGDRRPAARTTSCARCCSARTSARPTTRATSPPRRTRSSTSTRRPARRTSSASSSRSRP